MEDRTRKNINIKKKWRLQKKNKNKDYQVNKMCITCQKIYDILIFSKHQMYCVMVSILAYSAVDRGVEPWSD